MSITRRPCYLVVDREYAGNISSRKLVLETAKLNVITVYSAAEAVETLQRFPAIDGIVVDVHIADIPCQELITRLRKIHAKLTVIAIGPMNAGPCDGADYRVEAFEPRTLLELIAKLLPAETESLAERERELEQPE